MVSSLWGMFWYGGLLGVLLMAGLLLNFSKRYLIKKAVMLSVFIGFVIVTISYVLGVVFA